MIQFNQIDITRRVPGVYTEIDNSLASGVSTIKKSLIIGQRLSSGSKTANSISLCMSETDAIDFYGEGSMLHHQVRAFRKMNPSSELWVLALDDLVAGVQATGSIVVTGTVTKAGVIPILMGDNKVLNVGVSKDDSNDAVATKIHEVITAKSDALITSSVSTNTVTVTAKHKGELMNEFKMTLAYYDELLPEGITFAFTQLNSGAGNPDITSALAVITEETFKYIAMPYRDTANMTAMEESLEAKFNAYSPYSGHFLQAVPGTLAEMSAYGNSRNSKQGTGLMCKDSPSWPVIIGAGLTGVVAYYAAIDPSRQFKTLALDVMLPPPLDKRLDDTEREVLLWDGISTCKVVGGKTQIEALVTFFQLGATGQPDDSFLYITTKLLITEMRDEQNIYYGNLYPRHKLADDTAFAVEGLVRPKDMTADTLVLVKSWHKKGWIESVEQFMEDLFIERSTLNSEAMAMMSKPNLINNLRTIGNKLAFLK